MRQRDKEEEEEEEMDSGVGSEEGAIGFLLGLQRTLLRSFNQLFIKHPHGQTADESNWTSCS